MTQDANSLMTAVGNEVVLPDREPMLLKLSKISRQGWRKPAHSKLLELAGTRKTGGGVMIHLMLAFNASTVDGDRTKGDLLYQDAPRYLEALIDDADVLAEAMACLREMLRRRAAGQKPKRSAQP